MTLVLKGVMQSPVTPLKEDFSPDYETFEKLVDFNVRTGATAISGRIIRLSRIISRLPSARSLPKWRSRRWPSACRSRSM